MQPTSTSEGNRSTHHRSARSLPCTPISNGKGPGARGLGGSCRSSAPDRTDEEPRAIWAAPQHTPSLFGCAGGAYFSFCRRLLWKGDVLVLTLCDASYKSRKEHPFKSPVRKCLFGTTVFSRRAYPCTQLKPDVHYMNTYWKSIYCNKAKAPPLSYRCGFGVESRNLSSITVGNVERT